MSEAAIGPPAALIGAWELVSCTMVLADGSIEHPYGHEPGGVILYTPDGWMSAHLIGSGRASPGAGSCSSYFGRFSVSERDALVVHHVRGASDQRIVGDQPRRYRIDGDTLTLAAATDDASIEVIWKRPVP